jgi:tryptophan-rich sensory protein
MAKKIHYALSPLFYLLVLVAGRLFTQEGIDSWYPTLMKPSYTPPGMLIASVWAAIYSLSAVSFILFINSARGGRRLWPGVGFYVLSGIISAVWSYIFFVRHALGLSVLDAVAITLAVAATMVYVWPHSRLSSVLLLPYLLWSVFATSISYSVYVSN